MSIDYAELNKQLEYVDSYSSASKSEAKNAIKKLFRDAMIANASVPYLEKIIEELVAEKVRLELRVMELEKRPDSVPWSQRLYPTTPVLPSGVRVFNSQHTGDIRSGIDDPWPGDTPEK